MKFKKKRRKEIPLFDDFDDIQFAKNEFNEKKKNEFELRNTEPILFNLKACQHSPGNLANRLITQVCCKL